MRGHRGFAQALGEMARHALDHAARVREHERGVVLFDELRELVVNRGPYFAGHHRLERRRGHHEVDVALADVAAVDDAEAVRWDGQWPRECRDQPISS